tara:strand:+ start:127 stop:393 length:267 start_codon:yes stop_codon:yes gene_type:complete
MESKKDIQTCKFQRQRCVNTYEPNNPNTICSSKTADMELTCNSQFYRGQNCVWQNGFSFTDKTIKNELPGLSSYNIYESPLSLYKNKD